MACGDVLSLEDLQTAKKHQIFEAEVITGKAGGVAGGATIDTATNPVTGQTQQTLPSILADLGFDVQSWTSSTGGVLASANQVFLNDTPGSLGLGDYYAWGGTFPKTVPAGTDPALPAGGYIMRSSRFAGVQAREALRRSYAEAGYNLVDGSFEVGGTLTSVTDVLLHESTGKAYSGAGPFPQTVASGTNPISGGFTDQSGDLQVDVAGYAQLRSYAGASNRIYCSGRANIFDRAHGTFVLDTSDTTSADNDGTLLVDALGRRWKRLLVKGILPEFFGALGNGIADDIIALQKAADLAASRKSYVNVSEYTYKISSTLNVPTDCHIIGQSRNGSIISGLTKTFPLMTLAGSQTKVKGLYLRDGDIGINHKSGGANQAKIHDCRISYNRIGIDSNLAYITSIKDNYIVFNSWGIISGGGSYEVVIRDNVIDNNLGGGGIFAYGTSGLIITGNTIEGNRKEITPGGPSTGFGLWIVGLNQRTVVRDNWFEQNGNQDGCSDIILSRPPESWVDDLVTNCLPPEYQAKASVLDYTGQTLIQGNHHFDTKRAVAARLTHASIGTLAIENSTFVGGSGKFNRPVELYVDSGTSLNVRVANNNVTNVPAIVAEIMTGVKGSYVFSSGVIPALGVIQLDGKDLYTAYLTTAQFAALPGATLDATSRPPAGGSAELKNGIVKAVGGVNGARVVTGSGRPRAGMTAWFGTLGVPYAVVVLATGSGSGFTYQSSGGFGYRAANNPAGYFNIHTITPIVAEATIHTGDYYGWMVIPADTLSASLKGCSRLVVTDLDVVEKPLYAAAIPSLSTINYNLGDVIYNNAPVAGGKLGWVCVAAGSPGTWKPFGAIDA